MQRTERTERTERPLGRLYLVPNTLDFGTPGVPPDLLDVLLPVLAIAGGLAAKRHVPVGPGSFPTTGPLWVGLLIAVIVIVGGLTFLPSLVLGPIADQFQVVAGKTL